MISCMLHCLVWFSLINLFTVRLTCNCYRGASSISQFLSFTRHGQIKAPWPWTPELSFFPPHSEEPADLLCSQCQEVFCRRCGTAVHQRGRMARHQLQALSCEAEAAKKATPSPREAPKVQTDRLGRLTKMRSDGPGGM